MIRNFFRHVKDDFNAWRRGEVRTAPYGATGRVYTRKGDVPQGGHYQSNAEAVVDVELKILRADGTVEIRHTKGEVHNG